MNRDAELCVQFRAESFVESFGSADRFFQAAGEGALAYLEGLRRKNSEWPGSCVHAWLDDDIVGQVEVRRDPTNPAHAHVLLYYLRTDVRGRGFGDQLDAYVLDLCRAAGICVSTLRVSATNGRGLAYYRKHGWLDRGPDPDHPDVHLMERADESK